MNKTIDARGLSCPQPVLMTLDAMKEMDQGRIDILVDTDTSKENVLRAAGSQGWQEAGVEPDGAGFRITITKG